MSAVAVAGNIFQYRMTLCEDTAVIDSVYFHFGYDSETRTDNVALVKVGIYILNTFSNTVNSS